MTIALTMVFLMTMVLSLHLVVVAQGPGHTDLNGLTDLPGNRVALLPGDGVADLPGDLTGVLDGPLVALPLSVGMTLGSGRVPSVAASMASMATSMASLASVAAYMASIAASMASIAASMAGSGTGQGRNRDD